MGRHHGGQGRERQLRGEGQHGGLRGKGRRGPQTPIWLCVTLIGLAAWIYLSQVGAVAAANARLQAQQAITSQLVARQQDRQAELGRVETPAYIMSAARLLGMQPGAWGDNQGGWP